MHKCAGKRKLGSMFCNDKVRGADLICWTYFTSHRPTAIRPSSSALKSVGFLDPRGPVSYVPSSAESCVAPPGPRYFLCPGFHGSNACTGELLCCHGRIQAADTWIRSFIHSFTHCEAVLATVAHTGKGSWQLLASPNLQSGEEDISINNRSKNHNSNHM